MAIYNVQNAYDLGLKDLQVEFPDVLTKETLSEEIRVKLLQAINLVFNDGMKRNVEVIDIEQQDDEFFVVMIRSEKHQFASLRLSQIDGSNVIVERMNNTRKIGTKEH